MQYPHPFRHINKGSVRLNDSLHEERYSAHFLTAHTQVTVIPESITYTSDVTMLIISCAYETDDNNTLTVEWRHRGITLHSGDDPRVHIVENLCHTIIIDVGGMELQEISDRFSGEYACVAYNAYTSGTGVSQIIVPTGTSKTWEKLRSPGVACCFDLCDLDFWLSTL